MSIKLKFLLSLIFIGLTTLVSFSYLIFYSGNIEQSLRENLVREHREIVILFEMQSLVSEIKNRFNQPGTISPLILEGVNVAQLDEEYISLENYERVLRGVSLEGNRNELDISDRILKLNTSIQSSILDFVKAKNGSSSDKILEGKYLALATSFKELSQTIQESASTLSADVIRIGDEMKTREDRAQSLLSTILFVILASVFSLGYFVFRKVVKPLDFVLDDIRRIGNKEKPLLIPIEQENEIGEIGKYFNEMSLALSHTDIRLKQKEEEANQETIRLEQQIEETEKTKLAVLNLLEDIEQEKQNAEQVVLLRTKELSEEKARLVASIGSLSLGFVIANAENVLLLKNPAIMKILEIHDTNIPLLEMVKVIDKFDVLSACKKAMNTHQVVEEKEISFGKKYLRFFCAPIFQEHKADEETHNDDAIGYVFLLEDITEAKVVERSRDEFFAVASHELRTPLTAIRGNVDMILDMYSDKIVDNDMKAMLSDVSESSVRLIQIVNDFIEVSRIEQGKMAGKIENFDVTTIIEKVVRDLQVSVEVKNLKLEKQISTELPKVSADRGQVEQVLVNLVGNAMKFTHEGGITIEAKRHENFVKISVIDTGVGISEHNQVLLFRKFQQAGEKILVRENSQSSGLGLYISRLLISNMGGSVDLERSELGKGSTFVMNIPIAKE